MENLGEEVNSLRMEEAQPTKAMDVGPTIDGGPLEGSAQT